MSGCLLFLKYVWLFCHIKREGLEHFVVTLYLVKTKRHKFGGVQWQLCSEWCFLWAELGFDKKSTSAWTFSHGVLGSRDVSYPPPFGTHNIKLNFIQKSFGDTFAPISAFYGLWLNNLKVFGLSWNMEGKILISLLYQTFVGALQGNLYFNLGCLITNFLLCVCAFSDFDWPLATCINKLNAIAAKIYK